MRNWGRFTPVRILVTLLMNIDWRSQFQKLRTQTLSPETRQRVGNVLFKRSSWLMGEFVDTSGLEGEELEVAKNNPPQSETLVKPEATTQEPEGLPQSEKLKTITSLREFAEKEIEKRNPEGVVESDNFSFPGGELHLKPDQNTREGYCLKLEREFPKSDSAEHSQLLFVGDRPKDWLEVEGASEGSESLLSKMIAAMKLDAGQTQICFLSRDENEEPILEELLLEINRRKPLCIIALGAASTNLFLGRKERLSKVHGEFFEGTIEDNKQETIEYKILPLFHPDILRINPNMKRSAWIDLQKVLEFLGTD